MVSARRSVCVFCGARDGVRPAYRAAATALGGALAAGGLRLVYGAGDVGIMGAVAEAAQAAGGETLGVIPVHLIGREMEGHGNGRFIVTETMHERKKVMFMNSGAIAVLPGGAGSLDEFFEVLTWRQLGLHEKPVYLLNTEGYWDKLTGLLDHVIAEGFAEATLRSFVTVLPTVEALVEAMRRDLG